MIKKLLIVALSLILVGCGKDVEYVTVTGPAGPTGAIGPQGPMGLTGPQGPAGQDANSVVVVKLCPGVTTYPSKFVEVAFKIAGKLYVVYSVNNGFLTEMPPGNYSSNAVNSSCNFTVNADLSITN